MVARVEDEPVALLSAAFPVALSKVLAAGRWPARALPALIAHGHRPRQADCGSR
jgi:hypothetical protein